MPQKHSLRMRLAMPVLEEAFGYIGERFSNATRKIEHAAFCPEIVGFSQYSSVYREAVERVVNQSQIYYRYVAGVGEDVGRRGHRLHGIKSRIERLHSRGVEDPRYSSKVVLTGAEYNGINYFIFDDEELCIYIPGMDGEPGIGLFTKEREDIFAYSKNFSGLWHKAIEIRTLDQAGVVLASLENIAQSWVKKL